MVLQFAANLVIQNAPSGGNVTERYDYRLTVEEYKKMKITTT